MNWYELLFYKYIKGAQGQPKLRIMMPVFKGGTEQILPENGSTPTTAPIIADIRYPDALRTDQTFLYRESPTQESGNARLRRIKGNTLGWNQLVQNGNFADTTYWRGYEGSTISASNNEITAQRTGSVPWTGITNQATHSWIANHRYIWLWDAKSDASNQVQIRLYGSSTVTITGGTLTTNYQRFGGIGTYSSNSTETFDVRMNGGGTLYLKNVQCFDLTQMGLDSLTAKEFTSLFPLPYYDFNQGTLIPFSGNGIKTVGFNQWDEEWELGSIDSNGQNTPSTTEIRSKNYIPVILGESYYIKQTGVQVFHYYDGNFNYLGNQYIGESRLLSTPSGTEYIRFRCANTYGTSYKNDICLNISDPSKNGTYEPYTSSTLSLPISTYFPTGMKRAGNVYDELTESKAVTRISRVNLGTLNYAYNSASNRFQGPMPSDYKIPTSATERENLLCAKYETNSNPLQPDSGNGITGYQGSSYIFIRDTAYTDPTAFKESLSDVYLYYELATPTETPITTEDANEALSLLMGKSVSSSNANQLINIITKGE